MRKMNYTTIAPDGHSAKFGGGILVSEAKDVLWTAGKQTGTQSHTLRNITRET
jgi:hypothetical protein